MAQTPISSAAGYCSTTRLLSYHDVNQIADLVREGDGPRPTKKCVLDSGTDEGAKLVRIGLAAAGEIELSCFVGKRYSAADLAALTGAGLARLEKLQADLWFYALMENRQPGSADPEKIPGFARSLKMLEMLESGERIFGLSESADAGLPKVSEPDVGRNLSPIVTDAGRLFGTHRQGDGVTRRRHC